MVDIITDSRKIKDGDTFIAIKCAVNDGHKYIESAIQNGAKKIICEHGSYDVETVIVSDTKKYLEEYIYNNYYEKIKDIKLIGVTGTSGKTTTCYLVYQMLQKLGVKVAYIGTIGFIYGEKNIDLPNTTPEVDLVYNMLLECTENNIECVVMEVSSHSINENRIYGLEFDEVAFTNLSQDHLDYHSTMEEYANVKKQLFYKLREDKIAVINKDDSYYEKFLIEDNNSITIGETSADVIINNYSLTNTDINFTFTYDSVIYNAHLNMVGKYNIYNYLTALILVHKFGFTINSILNISDLSAPRGRMEMIKYKTNSIFVDYAHKPDAVKSVLENINKYKQGKVITVIGCGGDRDRTKRPIMGNIATTNSDYVILTNDNPRTEDEKKIMNDILEGINTNNYEVIYDRKKAIEKGIDMLTNNDILAILGKGHEDYQIIGTTKHHFDDKEIVLDYLDNLK